MAFKRKASAVALGLALLIGSGLSAATAQAAYMITLTEVGSNVVATSSGSLDLTGLSLQPTITVTAPFINPGRADLYVGMGEGAAYGGIILGPSNFGPGSGNASASGSGDVAGIAIGLSVVIVPEGYVSGTALSGNATWDNSSFTSLGFTPGTYIWSWGSISDASIASDDTLTLVAAVPEPSTVAQFGVGLAGLFLASLCRRRRQG
jgi:PEP-CTERM motif